MANELKDNSVEHFDDISELADPGRLAVIAVNKARYVRPTHYEDPVTKELRVYDLDAGLNDAMIESSISPAYSLRAKPAVMKIVHRIFPNEQAIMARRQAKLEELIADRNLPVDQQG